MGGLTLLTIIVLLILVILTARMVKSTLRRIFNYDSYEKDLEFDVPVYFISGDSDWITPYPLVEQYYESINAADKAMILIEGAGHSPFLENPEAFSAAVKTLLDR